MVTMTAAEFNRAPSAVKRRVMESDEPVLVTDRDNPSLVVMRYADYVHMSGKPLIVDVADWLRMDRDVDFEPTPMGLGAQAVEF